MYYFETWEASCEVAHCWQNSSYWTNNTITEFEVSLMAYASDGDLETIFPNSSILDCKN